MYVCVAVGVIVWIVYVLVGGKRTPVTGAGLTNCEHARCAAACAELAEVAVVCGSRVAVQVCVGVLVFVSVRVWACGCWCTGVGKIVWVA